MRSYGQHCGLAKALDVVGDRWTLLIVRELLIRDCRYTDLLHGLPGIATNMLADRLRDLERAGVVRREDAPPPIATTLFQLTGRGRELQAAVEQLGAWGAALLNRSEVEGEFRAHWMALPLDMHLRDRHPDQPAVSIELRTGDERVTLEIAEGEVRTRPGKANNPAAVMEGPPPAILGVLLGKIALKAARAAGLTYEGDPAILRRIQP